MNVYISIVAIDIAKHLPSVAKQIAMCIHCIWPEWRDSFHLMRCQINAILDKFCLLVVAAAENSVK